MAMSLEEAKRLTNKKLAEQRKGYLSENAYRQSPEFKEMAKNRLKNIGSAALDFTPYATYTDGKSAIENFKKGIFRCSYRYWICRSRTIRLSSAC